VNLSTVLSFHDCSRPPCFINLFSPPPFRDIRVKFNAFVPSF